MVVAALVATVVPRIWDGLGSAFEDAPLTVSVRAPDECPGGTYVFPGDFHEQDLPAFSQLGSRWVYEHGGWDSDAGVYDVTLQGRGDRAVVLQRLRVVDLERSGPPTKAVSVTKCAGAGDLYPRRFDVNLDDQPVSIVAVPGDLDIPDDRGQPAIGFPYTVSLTDPEVFWIRPRTQSCACSWRLELDWTSAGNSGTVVIDLDSASFRTAPGTAAERYRLNEDGTLERLG